MTALTTSSRKETGVLVVRVFLVDDELNCFGNPVGKIGTSPVGKLQVFPLPFGIVCRVVLLNKAAGAADQIKPHQIAPVIGVSRSFRRPPGTVPGNDAAGEFGFALLAEEFFRPDADVFLFVDEQPKLIGQVEIGLVVGRGGEQNDPAVVGADVLGDGPIATSLAVAKIVAFVDEHQAEATQCREVRAVTRVMDNTLARKAILLPIVFPHARPGSWGR